MRTRTARLCVTLIALFAIGCTETSAPPPASTKAAPPPTEYAKQGNKTKGAPLGPEGVVP